MMAGNPNSWGINGMHIPQQTSSFVYANSHHHNSDTSDPDHHQQQQDFPVRSWSQFLLGGGGEERFGGSLFQQQKKLENWEDEVLNLNPSFSRVHHGDVKQEVAQSLNYDDEFHTNRPSNTWPNPHLMPIVSSPNSCTNTFLNFSGGKSPMMPEGKKHPRPQDHSSECNSTSSGGTSNKKARVHQSSAQPVLKVRKEKLGDRITALHQIVSPFGKTDTASVLSEAIGYIRFLQSQIEALSSPYMQNGSGSGSGSGHHQHSVSVQERNCLFSEEGNEFLNEHMGVDGRSKQECKDLRSRGLCLVPISCTQNVANESGADYWAPAAFGGGGGGF